MKYLTDKEKVEREEEIKYLGWILPRSGDDVYEIYEGEYNYFWFDDGELVEKIEKDELER